MNPKYGYPKGTTPPHSTQPTSVTPIAVDPRLAEQAARPVKGATKGPTKQEMQITQIIADGGYPEPEREHRFAASVGRRYRFDWAWPDQRIALEFEGGTFGDAAVGGHTGHGYTKDCTKYALAVAMGWRVYRCSSLMLKTGEISTLLMLMFGRVTPARYATLTRPSSDEVRR